MKSKKSINRGRLRKIRSQFDSRRESQIMGLLAAGVAHEFNNILGAVDGHADWALSTQKLEDCVEALQVIRQACQRSLQVTRALQHFAQPLEETVEKIALLEIVQALKKDFDRVLSKQHIELRIDIPRAMQFSGVRAKWEELLRNLIKNSIEAHKEVQSSQQAWIQIQARRLPKKNSIRKNPLEILVSDNGPGIPESLQGHLFQPFFTTKGVLRVVSAAEGPQTRGPSDFEGGSGLGLYRAKTLARESGGDLELKKSNSQGTTWSIKF